VAALAMRDVCSRAVPASIASLQLAAWAFISIVPAGLAMMLVMGTPPAMLSAPDAMRLGAIFVIGALAYYALVGATRIGEVSAVVPFRYTRLVFAMIRGRLIFDERPDALMLTGAALIVGTGVYTLWRGGKTAPAATRRASASGPQDAESLSPSAAPLRWLDWYTTRPAQASGAARTPLSPSRSPRPSPSVHGARPTEHAAYRTPRRVRRPCGRLRRTGRGDHRAGPRLPVRRADPY